jgi:hypothetical protein
MADDPLAAQLEITDLLARVAHATDADEITTLLDCLTEDVVIEREGQRTTGQAEMRALSLSAREQGTVGPRSNIRHVLTTISVTISGARATSRSVWLLVETAVPTPGIIEVGEYRDVLQNTPTGWKLARRRILPC